MALLSVKALSSAYRDGSLTPDEVVASSLERIESLNPRFNWFITVLGQSARESAAKSTARFKDGKPLGPLDGVPLSVKDLFYIKGVRCTAGSKILADNVAQSDSPSVAGLKSAGAVLLGTTNLHEFAAGVTSENPHFGPVRNPWDEERVAGGSSGGSAASVAGGVAAGSLGTDTAGSVRIPAALCGVVGLKPTYGRVSRLGVIPLASSLDTVGVLAGSAWDAAALLKAIAWHEPGDPTAVPGDVPDYPAELGSASVRPRIGVPRRYFHDILDEGVEDNFQRFVSRLNECGFSVSDVELDGIEEIYDRWLPVRRAEATAFHLKWLDTSPELYGADVRRLLELGRDVKAVDYVNSLNARPSYIERFLASMKDVDMVAAPTTCVPAPMIGQTKVRAGGAVVEVYHALNRLTLPFNYVGLPAVSVPSGTVKGLPVGVQLVGKLFEESALLRAASVYEETFGPYPVHDAAQ